MEEGRGERGGGAAERRDGGGKGQETRGEDAADDRAGHSVRCPNFALVALDGLGRKAKVI